jgi:hypothetical protein
MREYLTEAETAKRTKLGAGYLKKLRHVGGGPPFIKVAGGRRVLYDGADVDDWLSKSKVRSTSEASARAE